MTLKDTTKIGDLVSNFISSLCEVDVMEAGLGDEFRGMAWDRLGMGVILYFPRVEYVESKLANMALLYKLEPREAELLRKLDRMYTKLLQPLPFRCNL